MKGEGEREGGEGEKRRKENEKGGKGKRRIRDRMEIHRREGERNEMVMVWKLRNNRDSKKGKKTLGYPQGPPKGPPVKSPGTPVMLPGIRRLAPGIFHAIHRE